MLLDSASEIIVFASPELKQKIITEFQPSTARINKSSYSSGLPLRISSEGCPKTFLETAVRVWKENKENIRLTLRVAKGKTLEINDSSMPEVELMLSQMT